MSKDIAIIGMAGRFPDADNLDELYVNLSQGKDSVREISKARLESTTLPLGQEYRICGYLEDVDKFDCHFFNISLAEAQTMEPNQRVLLEVTYEIFENAAYSIDSFAGSNTCIYVAEAGNDYHKHAEKILPTLITGNAREFLAARLARQFNLRGTASMVNTSCSSALVAVQLACNELILRDADYALVCAVNIDLFPYNDNSFSLGLLSPDGKSRAFSARANGMSRGETAAGVLLKPLDKAIKDNDIIHAVIKGSAVNNNAKSSASLSAPDSQTQAEVIKKAWEKAGINPTDIGFIEAHGSGTELGDILEIEGLDLAFQQYTDKKRFCPISTIKSNVGHGVFASGMSGLIEAVLSLKHKVIFPTIHFDAPNPLIDFDRSAVYINDTLKKWEVEEGKKRIAGVSSIGFSGTNCHMVLQEALRLEIDEKNNSALPRERYYLITVSSKTLKGLKENLEVLLQKIDSGNSYRLNDIAYTLNKGRKHYNFRFACIAYYLEDLKHQLAVGAAGINSMAEKRKPLSALEKLIFIFSDHEEIPDRLIGFFLSKYPLFEKYFHQCRACSTNHRNVNFRHFAFQYSFYKLLASRGIITENILAVGIGRITRAVISGDLMLEQAVNKVISYEVEEITGLEERVKSLIQKETGDQPTAFIDIGPGGTISRELENQDPGAHRFYVFWLNQDTANTDPLLQLLKSLYLANYDIDWGLFYKHQQDEGRKIELPGYQFRKVRCWLREEPTAITGETRTAVSTSYPLYQTGSETEEKIAGYWREVLGVEKFYLEDNFFEKGGDSLKATKVINRINQAFMLELDFEDIFDFPTIKALGEYIDSLLSTQQKMALIWKEVLNVQRVEKEDHFFELGGHSLLATQVLNRIKKEYHLELNFEEFFQHPTLLSICQYIDKLLAEGKKKIEYSSIEPVEKKEYHPLSSAQQRLYLLQHMEKENTGYNGCEVMVMEGELRRELLQSTFRKLIARHESFRTSFELVGEEPVQRIHSEVEFKIEYDQSLVNGHWSLANCQGRGEVPSPIKVEKIIRNFIRPFELSQAPLLRVGLIKTGGKKHVLMVDIHHIITDGTSMALLVRDFMTLYEGHLLPTLRIQYKDFTQWQNKKKECSVMVQQQGFWLKEFAGEIPGLNLPTDYPRPRVQGFAGSSLQFEIGKKETAAFKELANNENITLFMLLLAVYNVLLSKLCGQEDIVVGSPVAGRRHEDLQSIIGMFVNTLALRNYPRGDIPFTKFLKEIKEKTLAAFENQDYPFEDLVDHVVVERDVGRNPLFDSMLVLQNMKTEDILIPGLKLKPYAFDAGVSHFDLVFVAQEAEEQLSFYLEYSTRLFAKNTVEQLIRYFKNLIFSIPVDPHREISALKLILEDEKQQLLVDFNSTKADYPGDHTIHQWFQEQVEKIPDHIALIGTKLQNTNYKQNGNFSVTYKELNNKSNQLARLLRSRGLGPGGTAALLMDSSIGMIIGILGILKAGGAYQPIEPAYPPERICLILEDSRASILLTQHEVLTKSNCEVILLEQALRIELAGYSNENLEHVNRIDDLLYLISTSGSTGSPKSIVLEHRNLVNLLHHEFSRTGVDFSGNVLQFASVGFDVSAQEIFSTLLSGGKLHLMASGMKSDLPRWFDFIRENQIEIAFLPPVFLKFIFDDREMAARFPTCVRHIIAAGEALVIPQLLKHHLSRHRVYLHNHYGPSETHVVTAFIIDPSGEIPALPPIGKPISNTQIYIMDNYLNLQPIGIAGELCIGGNNVGRGYLNNPELTSKRFINYKVQNYKTNGILEFMQSCNHASMQYHSLSHQYPITPLLHSPIYRTGDLARWLQDGNIEFSGRIDHQVKIRGFRIELGEIENQLAKYPGIKETVLINKEINGEKCLCAFVVSFKEIDIPGIRDKLSDMLPDYMIPSHFLQLEKLPLTPNGKIDRKALPHPVLKVGDQYTAPRDEIEKQLIKIWAELLQLEERVIGIDANFFTLGGHSLKATLLTNKIHKTFQVEIPLTEIFKQPTIRELSKYIKRVVKVSFIPIEPIEKKEYYQLSSAQKRLYILQQTQPDSIVYNISEIFAFAGEVRKMKLERVFREMIKRHESLRTSFQMGGEEPFQIVHNEVEFDIEYYKAGKRQEARGNKQKLMYESLIRDFIRPFDLTRAPLLRVGLIHLGEYKHILMVDMHHIISDGTSIGILIKDFMALYANRELEPLRIRYGDYLPWQTKRREQESLRSQERFWIKEFEGEIPVLNLYTDFKRPVLQSFKGKCTDIEISAEASGALRLLALEEGVTLFMVLLAIINILLSKLSGQEDIVIGIPIEGRNHENLRQMVGMFVNTLAFRNYPVRNKTFLEFLYQLKEKNLAAFENQEYPFEELVEKVEITRDTSRNPLFDVMFVFQNMDTPVIEIPGLNLKPIPFETDASKFDLSFHSHESNENENIFFSINYCTELFTEKTIKGYCRYFNRIIVSILEDRSKRIGDIEMIPGDEKEKILQEFNHTSVDYPRHKTIHQLFRQQVEKTPDHIAVIGEMQSAERRVQSIEGDKERPAPCAMRCTLTYRELNEKSDRLAYLLKEKGVGLDTIVCIMVERSPEMMVGILGILKAGGAYLPIDPDYPADRISYMLADSSAKNLVISPVLSEKFEKLSMFNCQLLMVNEKPPVRPSLNIPPKEASSHLNLSPAPATSLAYLIYTSGSTGVPKGVIVEHRSAVNVLTALQKRYPLKEADTYLLKTSYLFDVSVAELFGWFFAGGRLAILEKNGEKDPGKIIDAIEQANITHINFVPSMFRLFVEELTPQNINKLSVLKYIFLAGEALLPEPVEKFKRLTGNTFNITLENIYGPTEGTIYSCWYSLAHWQKNTSIPIGKPLPNIRLYILDQYGSLQPTGVPGELCIAGDGLVRGYLNNPELTDEKFNHDLWYYLDYHDKQNKSFCRGVQKLHGAVFSKSVPLAAIGKLYKTGDLARWFPDGNIEFLGRIDRQVKIRGFRVELGEIESRLLKVSGVKEAVVLVREEVKGDKYICAYFVSDRAYGMLELRESLSKELPDYMIPSYFMEVKQIPLTPSGKIDRKALPTPEIEAGEEYIAPRNEMETKIAGIWSEVLGIEKKVISIDSNFFQSGGHSLKAAIMALKIHKELKVELPLVEIFKTPTIRGLSGYIGQLENVNHAEIEPVEKREYYPLSSAQKRLYIVHQMKKDNIAYNSPGMMILEGELRVKWFEETNRRLIDRHESLRTSFHMMDDTPIQRIHDQVEFEIEFYDSVNMQKGISNKEELLVEPIIKKFILAFDLSQAPLLRVGLIKVEPQKHILMVDMHHIITDGTSQEIFTQEFMALYGEKNLSPLKIQYKDYSEWRDRPEQKELMKQQESYWLNLFSGELPTLNLPTDYSRSDEYNHEGDIIFFTLKEKLGRGLKELAEKEKTTLFTILLTNIYILFSKICRQRDLVIGTPVAGRRHLDIYHVIGFFVNTLALRNFPTADKTFTEFLYEVRDRAIEAFENQDYPLEELANQLGTERSAGRNPVFDVIFAFQNIEVLQDHLPEIEISDLIIKPYKHKRKTSPFDLVILAYETGDTLTFNFLYRIKLFKKGTINRLIKYFEEIITSVLENQHSTLGDIKISPGLLDQKLAIPQIDFSF